MKQRTPAEWRRVLTELRAQRGWTQRQLAAALGVSYSLVTKWETGARTPNALAAQVIEYHCRRAENETVDADKT